MSAESSKAAGRLCLDCGMCCNGVMFDRVELQLQDQARVLTALGLKIKKRSFFVQPCSALCGVLCTIYEDRPTRCHKFVCRQYQQVASSKITEETALARIRDVKAQVASVEKLLNLTGGDNLRKSLAQRYATAMAQAEKSPDHTELVQAMERLQAALSEHFRV